MARIESLLATKPGAFNSFATPGAIWTQSSQIKAGDHFLVHLPPASVSVITLSVR